MAWIVPSIFRNLPTCKRWSHSSLRVVLVMFMTLQLDVSCGADHTRQPWTSSRVKGSPEPPLALDLEPAFPALKFNDPMHVRWQEDLQRYFVCELGGRVWSFEHDEDVTTADLVIDLKESLKSFDPQRSSGVENVFSIVFDPDFANNRYVYACIILRSKTGKPLEDGSRISRFKVTEEVPPRFDIESELPIITWLGGGHNGCDLAFDNNGCLLISTGDAAEPSPPDRLATGQDISDLLSSVLRIDVRGATSDKPYKIPEDNPFRDVPGARPEVWAFGFRNPWRMSVDPVTSQLWLGDVGWEKWELIHRVERGGNYGWSVREGNELLQPNVPIGPAPIKPTRVMLSHADAASITGGFVYRGEKLHTIKGEYLFGDWITGRIWSVPLDDTSPHREVASGQLRIIAFAPDRDGEPLVVNHLNGTNLFRLTENRQYANQLRAAKNFPRLLSQTGLFTDVRTHKFASGIRPFTINQPQWCDGAVAEHAIALPDMAQVTVTNEPIPVGSIAMFNTRLHYPPGTVLVRTLSMPDYTADASHHSRSNDANEASDAPAATAEREAARRIETQLLHFDGRLWHGTSYVWNQAQSDAELAPPDGLELTLSEETGQRWRIHSRSECLQCHNPWPETTLAFTPEQMHQPAAGDESEWLKLVREGYVVTQDRQRRPIDPERCVRRPLVSAHNRDAAPTVESSFAQRARSYLHANCAHCHQNGAGTAVDLSLKINDDGKAMKAIDVAPTKGNFGLLDSKLIAPGNAAGSTLVYRMASSSIGRMPHIGSNEVDFAGLALIADWIDGMSTTTDTSGPPARSLDAAQLEHEANALSKMAKQSSQSSSADGQQRSELMRRAVSLAIEMARSKAAVRSQAKPSSSLSEQSLRALAGSNDPLVSSLFEAHLPARLRQRRLGPGASFAEIADVRGDVARGEQLFFDTTRSQCSKCHRVGSRGIEIGPDLSKIGAKYSPAQLFESIADPSRVIDPKYQSYIVVLAEGKIVTGVLVDQSSEQISLTTPQGERLTIAAADIDFRRVDSKSLMPSGLTGELTAQQAADLIAYLSSLK